MHDWMLLATRPPVGPYLQLSMSLFLQDSRVHTSSSLLMILL